MYVLLDRIPSANKIGHLIPNFVPLLLFLNFSFSKGVCDLAHEIHLALMMDYVSEVGHVYTLTGVNFVAKAKIKILSLNS